MYTRRLKLPLRTFFLLGPRGTGKSTWLRAVLPQAKTYNLLLDRELLRLERDPAVFRGEVDALPDGSWVVVDEVQRLPALLNEVHDVLSVGEPKIRFALSGSSARRLRQKNVNLLAGRALSRQFFPLTSAELGTTLDIDQALRYGLLPSVVMATDDQDRLGILEAYKDTYLSQEIRAEGLVRRLDAFHRFLEVVALMNAQVTNVSSLARDAGVTRPTVQGFFEVLVDTLLATMLPAFRPRARVKEVGHPKLYLFDAGVARVLAGRIREPMERAERGHLFETWIHHELRAAMHDLSTGGSLSYWRTPAGLEVDFIWSRADVHIGIEVKASERFRIEETAGLRALHEQLGLARSIVVYLGPTAQKVGDIEVLPVREFFAQLGGGTLLQTRK